MGIKDMAAKAKEKLVGDNSAMEERTDMMADKYDNATDERYTQHTERAQDAVNERMDDFGDEGPRQNRDISGT